MFPFGVKGAPAGTAAGRWGAADDFFRSRTQRRLSSSVSE